MPRRPRRAPAPARIPRRTLYLLVALLAAAVVLVASVPVLISSPMRAGGAKTQYQSTTLVDVAMRAVGPQKMHYTQVNFTIAATALAAWVNGTVTASSCPPPGHGCVTNVWVLTPSNWASTLNGTASPVVWCYHGPACEAQATTTVASGDLEAYAGTALSFVVWGNATRTGEQFTADVELVWGT
jgi:hypothetical protein